MIRIERDPAFWVEVASHPAVRPSLFGLPPEVIGQLVANAQVTPLAAEHGGFLLTRLDALGLIHELHTLFTPEGWGREAAQAGFEGMQVIMRSAQVLVTQEVEAFPRSKPWRGMGWRMAGDWQETQLGLIREWIVTREDWQASRAYGRLN